MVRDALVMSRDESVVVRPVVLAHLSPFARLPGRSGAIMSLPLRLRRTVFDIGTTLPFCATDARAQSGRPRLVALIARRLSLPAGNQHGSSIVTVLPLASRAGIGY